MTLDSKLSKNVYQGNGSTTVFPFAFKVWSTSQITVTMTDAEGVSTDVTSNSTATLTSSGGSVTYPKSGSPLPSGAKLAITRNMPFTQGINLTTASRFDPQVLEDAFDQGTAERQQIFEMMGRAVILPATSSQSPEEVVAGIYSSMDAAAASANTASVQATAAQNSADAAAHSADTAAQNVLAATDVAVTAATAKANAAAASATDAANSAAQAAESAAAVNVTAATPTKRGIGRVATAADAAPGSAIDGGPAFLDASTFKISATPAAGVIPAADGGSKLDAWISTATTTTPGKTLVNDAVNATGTAAATQKCAYDTSKSLAAYTLKATRTTSGTITLTDCVIGKPVLVLMSFSTNASQYAQVKVTSGANDGTDGGASNGFYLGLDTAASTNCFMCIATSTTVVISANIPGNYTTVRVYN